MLRGGELNMLQLPEKVEMIEVGPRDGLQNEKNFVPTEIKKEFIYALKNAGLKVPQMADAAEIIADCLDSSTRNIVLAPNKKGIERVYMTNCKSVAVFVGVSNSFNLKNINKTTQESLAEVLPLIAELKAKDYFVRACISTAFYCPYEGKVDEDAVLALCEEFVQAGVDELSVADTIGMAAPHESYSLFSKLKEAYPDLLLTAHFHDTRKLALANILAALQAGVTRFDTSAGGLGGCPFAPGAAGNAATEDVVYMLHRMGIDTGVDLDKLIQAIKIIKPHISRPIESTYYQMNSVSV
jgi:hydroxymethylglutaryl-CoA lyase